MKIGDIVVRKSYSRDITFKIIDIKVINGKKFYILKGMNIRILADSVCDDLEVVDDGFLGKNDKILNSRVSEAIKKSMENRKKINLKQQMSMRGSCRIDNRKDLAKEKENFINEHKINNKEMIFGRPGKILHVDGDKDYLEMCLKVYKQLSLEAVGKAIPEHLQSSSIVDLVKEIKPDIVVMTGHDSILRGKDDFLDLNNYRNSKYYIDSVKELRNYNSSYDELIIFAGACQSCYECLLDAGANFASSPNRVLIHCLDPVFICEKIAYTGIDTIVSISEVIDSTITGIKGIGGLQTRGKYRQGYPKSLYI